MSYRLRSIPAVDKCNVSNIMSPDILIVRGGDGYRLLHGHLRLANVLGAADEVSVEVPDEGTVSIVKTRTGYVVGKDKQRLPLYRN